MQHPHLPLVSLEVLLQLEASLNGDRELCRRYVETYVEQWNRRLSRLGAACGALDWDAAMDSVLSVKSSSLMVGALRLGRKAEDLEQLVRRHDTAAAEAWRRLEDCGASTIETLRADYLSEAA